MLGIGEFARLGQVSARMLRHYDKLGLLTPAAVDAASGRRSYHRDQLPRLHRITALTALGLPLRQVHRIVDDQVSPADLQEELERRREQLAARIAEDTVRLEELEARLRATAAGAVSTHDTADPPFAVTSIEPVRVAQLSAVAGEGGAADRAPLDQLFTELARRLAAAGVEPAGPRIVPTFVPPEVREKGREAHVTRMHATVVVDEDATLPDDVEDTWLPAIPTAVVSMIIGDDTDVFDADSRTVAWWLTDNGYHYDLFGPHREVYLTYSPDDPAREVVELQMSISRASADHGPRKGASAGCRTSATVPRGPSGGEEHGHREAEAEQHGSE